MKISIFIATSLDGFIARKNGDLDWLPGSNPESPEAAAGDVESPGDGGYKDFSDTVDCIVMGRNTVEMVMAFPGWPYEGKRLVVLSNTLKEVPSKLIGKIELYSGSIVELVRKLESEGCKRLYIDGGKTIQSFLDKGLITDLTITTIPVLLGEGIPLFGKIKEDIKLKHISTTEYPGGFVQSTYEV